MRSVIQVVSQAAVTVQNHVVGAIGPGLLVFISFGPNDTETTVSAFVTKLARLNLEAPNQSIVPTTDTRASRSILLVSQFTLHASLSKGRHPSFSAAASASHAKPLYDATVQQLSLQGFQVKTGQFGAHMNVTLTNDGPQTFLLDVAE